MANWLDTLLKISGQRSAPSGRIPGTKDYGITENLRIGSGVNKGAEGIYNTLTDASRLASTVARAGDVQGTGDYRPELYGQSKATQSIGTPSSPSGSYSTPSYTPSGTDDLEDNAGESKQSAIDAIKQRMGLIRDTVNRQISTAGTVKDQLLNSIASTYGGLRTEAQDRVGTSLENLSQERTGVYDTYGGAKGEARRAVDSGMLKNRMLARAMGRLNSSFYEDRQAEATQTGARNIGSLAREEAGKVAGIGTRETETKNWGEQTQMKLSQEEGDLKMNAENEYQQKVDDAMAMEQSFGIDSEEDLRNAEIEYQSKLDAINQYVENRAMRMMEIQATAGITGAGISGFSAYTPELANLLSNKQAFNAQETVPTFENVGGGATGYLPWYNQNIQQGTKLDELLGNFLSEFNRMNSGTK